MILVNDFFKIQEIANKLLKKYDETELRTLATSILYKLELENKLICCVFDSDDVKDLINEFDESFVEHTIQKTKYKIQTDFVDSVVKRIKEETTAE